MLEAIDSFCAGYPKKKGPFRQVSGAVLFVRRSDRARLIGFGTLDKTGALLLIPDWSLALVGREPTYRLELAQARMHSGLVDEATELERFLNTLEQELKSHDRAARVSLRSS